MLLKMLWKKLLKLIKPKAYYILDITDKIVLDVQEIGRFILDNPTLTKRDIIEYIIGKYDRELDDMDIELIKIDRHIGKFRLASKWFKLEMKKEGKQFLERQVNKLIENSVNRVKK